MNLFTTDYFLHPEQILPHSLLLKLCPALRTCKLTLIPFVAEGYKNAEIASALETTEHVVKNNMRAIYEALGFCNRVELSLWYVQQETTHPRHFPADSDYTKPKRRKGLCRNPSD